MDAAFAESSSSCSLATDRDASCSLSQLRSSLSPFREDEQHRQSGSGGVSGAAHHHPQASYYRKRNSDPKVFAIPPVPPTEDTAEGWSRFLQAYRTGRWNANVGGEAADEDEDEDEDGQDVTTVVDMHDCPMSSQRYFEKYNHLAAPHLSPKRKRRRHEVLLRHGLTHPHLRPNLQRYVELAKRLFACDMVTLSFASADEGHIIFIAADGPPMSQVPQCASICSHALLLEGENDVFLVPDMARDWRFEHLFTDRGPHKNLGYRFHASAPIFLSSSETPCCNISMATLHAGRFSIFGSKPRPEFNAEDCRLLLNLARMTEEGIEHEFLDSYVYRSRRLQHDTAEIFRSLDQLAEDRADVPPASRTAATAIESVSDKYAGPRRRKTRYNPTSTAIMPTAAHPTEDDESVSILCDSRIMGQVVDMVRESLGAKMVCIIDASDLDAAPPFLGWIQTRSSSKVPSRPRSAGAFSSSSGGKARQPIQTVALSGDADLAPLLESDHSTACLQSCFDFVLARGRQGLPQLFRRSIVDQEGDDGQCPFHVHDGQQDGDKVGPCCCSMLGGDMRNLLLPLLSERALSAFIIPIFANDVVAQKRTPLAMVFAVWDVERAINTGEVDFCTTIGIQLASIAIRDQASKVRRGQMDFLRTMQHELRTPLNGITCISEALCDNVDESMDSTSDSGDSKGWLMQGDLSGRNGSMKNRTLLEQLSNIEDRNTSSFKQVVRKAALVLAPQLESIHISGMMLKTILDDILSFDTIFQAPGTSFSQKMLESNSGKQINLVDLTHEIEDVCREELRFFALQSLRTFRATSGATPTTPLDVVEQQQGNGTLPTSFSEAAKMVQAGGPMTGGSQQTNGGNDEKGLVLPATVLLEVDPSLNRQYRSDRLKLRKIVGKLISNALRYTPADGLVQVFVRPSTSLAAIAHADRSLRHGVKPYSPSSQEPELSSSSRDEDVAHAWINITITDSGIGMSQAFVAQKYLQPFNKADQFGQGIGLGATVACILVQSLGGSFYVESDVKRGTTVSVFLPMASVAQDMELATALQEKLDLENGVSKETVYARFIGFDQAEGPGAVAARLQTYLTTKKRTVTVLSDRQTDQAANLLFVHESILQSHSTALPRELGKAAVHTVILSQNPTNMPSEAECMKLIMQGPHAYFRPPFGPSAFTRLGQLIDSISLSASVTGEGMVNGCRDSSTGGDTVQEETADEKVQDVFTKERERNESVDHGSALSISTSISAASIASAASRDSPGAGEAVLSPTSPDLDDTFRVLVVEDNPINMRLITSLLRKLKCPFAEAHDGMEAVEQYKLYRPSVVLLDISLPLMDGFGACTAMRAHVLPFRPKIIAITALSADEDKVRGITVCGMDDWHTKPISIRMLRTNVDKWRQEWVLTKQSLSASCAQQADKPALTAEMQLTGGQTLACAPSSSTLTTILVD